MKRSSGALLHVSSLWGDYSIGSLGKSAREWIDKLQECGFTYWQVLPFCLPDEANSPYKSYSAFSLNPMFIDLPSLYNAGLITLSELEEAKQKNPYACEFDRLNKERLSLLSKAAQRFDGDDLIESFMDSHPHTKKFCEFMALKASNDNKPFYLWKCNTPHEETLKLWKFTQYIFFTQWKDIKSYANKKGIKIIGDIPIYVSDDSSDVWEDTSLFQLDENLRPERVAGVPPDYFSEDGQLWGNPLYDWDKMKKTDYKWWRERVSFMSELFDGVRIDHFRAFESYFSIPATDENAKNGVWVKGPGMSVINAIKEAAPDALIIAEDLGDITDEVRDLVDESTFPGMRVLQFGFLGDPDSIHLPHNYPANSVAYTGTHDNNTLLGYVWELDGKTRINLMKYCGFEGADWNKCYNAILRTMFASHAGLLILPLQDLLLYGADTRLNTPGTAKGNWSFRITKEQVDKIDTNKFMLWNQIYARI
ncbi:MAG: 4-alpha-glucanotransferase [Clostridia bacterium]|nr:4-alpha-glucanotransferase [Clostridia bacterium]